MWSIKYKHDVKILPSINEIMTGLQKFITMLLTDKMSLTNEKLIWINACTERYKKVFDYIIELMDIRDPDRPLTSYELRNPESKAVCLIMYMYSMESPFSYELNNSWKSTDTSKIYYFGPIERALYEILEYAESNRRDRLQSSSFVSQSQSFLLYKGASMTKHEIALWKQNVGKRGILPANIGFYEYMRVALCSVKC